MVWRIAWLAGVLAAGSALTACGWFDPPSRSSSSDTDLGAPLPSSPPPAPLPAGTSSVDAAAPPPAPAPGAPDAATDAPSPPADAGPDVVVDAGPPVCGDGVINQPFEQCDDGPAPPAGSLCTSTCQVQEALVVPPVADSGAPARSMGLGRHPIAGGSGAFAVTYTERSGQGTQLLVKLYDAHDVQSSPAPLAPPSDALAAANPVVAALPSGGFAAAFTSPSAPGGDGADIVLAGVSPAGAVGPASTANTSTIGAQSDPDVVWTGTELVVAWTDTSTVGSAPDLRMQRFDASLNPLTGGDEDLAVTADAEGDVALAAFGGAWAAAWRATAEGGEYIRARTPGASFSVGPYLAGPNQARPAIVPVDAGHLLVLYLQGRDDQDAGFATSSSIRGVVLDTSAGTAGAPFDLTTPDGTPIGALEVNASASGGAIAVGWRSPAAPGGALGEDVWISYWTNVAGPADLQAPLTPVAVPRSAAHRAGDQRALALAPLSNAPAQFVAAWDDLGRSFGAGEGGGDVVALRLPPLHADPAVADDITLDATPLTEQQMQLPGVTPSFDSKVVQHLSLLPGAYSVYTGGGYVVAPDGSLAAFTVKSDGTIDYDPALNGVFLGAGSTKLTVNGVPLTVDARSLTEQQMQLPGVTPSYDSKTVQALRVTPGGYSVYTGGGYVLANGAIATLAVKNDGTLSWDPSLNGLYSAAYSPTGATLTITGLSLTVDATSLTEQQMQLPGVTPSYDSKTVQALRVTPGGYSVYTGGGYITANGAIATLAIASDGKVSWDPSLNKIYAVTYSPQGAYLTITGLPLTVDARSLTEQQMQLPGVTPSYDSKAPRALTLAPGGYSVYTAGGYITANGAIATLAMSNDGTVSWDPSLGRVYAVSGTTLTISGFPIAVDATRLTAQQVELPGVTPAFDSKTPQPLTLAPGGYSVYSAGGYVLGPDGSIASVTVQNDGRLGYDPSLEGPLAGATSTTLTLAGVAIGVDATAHPGELYAVEGVTAPFDGSVKASLQILPGTYVIDAASLGTKLGAVTVQSRGNVAYDASLGSVFGGSGTSTVVVR